jgi:mRNA-degrading endonuclease RelE of RelBE toxin-antitoxin system
MSCLMTQCVIYYIILEMAATVVLTPNAREQLDDLPITIHGRVQGIIERLAKWPEVSGAKPLRGKLKGAHRIRTGDWRLIFKCSEVSTAEPKYRIDITRIDNRRDVYED